MLPEPGQIVRVRSRQYLVEEVARDVPGGQDTRVRMSCVDDDAQGEPLEGLLHRADEALYAAKEQGRNRVARG